MHLILKGYCCYKMIISQNLSSQAQVKNFLFHRKVMYHSQDNQVLYFKHPMICYIYCEVMMSIISTWDRVHFWVHLLNRNSLSHQTWPISRYKLGEKLSEIFWTFWRTGPEFQVLFNLGICSNYSVTNCVKVPQCFIFFGKVKNGLKIVNVNY